MNIQENSSFLSMGFQSVRNLLAAKGNEDTLESANNYNFSFLSLFFSCLGVLFVMKRKDLKEYFFKNKIAEPNSISSKLIDLYLKTLKVEGSAQKNKGSIDVIIASLKHQDNKQVSFTGYVIEDFIQQIETAVRKQWRNADWRKNGTLHKPSRELVEEIVLAVQEKNPQSKKQLKAILHPIATQYKVDIHSAFANATDKYQKEKNAGILETYVATDASQYTEQFVEGLMEKLGQGGYSDRSSILFPEKKEDNLVVSKQNQAGASMTLGYLNLLIRQLNMCDGKDGKAQSIRKKCVEYVLQQLVNGRDLQSEFYKDQGHGFDAISHTIAENLVMELIQFFPQEMQKDAEETASKIRETW